MDTQDIQDNISLGFAIILYILSIHVKFLLVAAMLRYDFRSSKHVSRVKKLNRRSSQHKRCGGHQEGHGRGDKIMEALRHAVRETA